jgi:hypothetical protein
MVMNSVKDTKGGMIKKRPSVIKGICLETQILWLNGFM